MKTPLLLVVLTALLFDFSPARAQWQQDGTPPCLSNVGDFQPKIVSDGAGGVIVTWYSFQPTDYDIIAQHLSAGGVAQWTSCVSLCSAANGQVYPAIVTDGAGGAIVAWEDRRVPGNYDIYAQRVNAAGVVQWATNGVLVCGAANNQTVPVLVSDGAGGAIVTWQDFRNGANFDLYAQRVNAAGAMQWTANGVVVCTAAGDQDSPTITTDGAAGAIVSWYDFRIATSDIYAQRINAAGAAQWTANGAALCTAADNQYNPVATADGSGGAFVAWHDRRNGANYDVFAQRINAAGAVQWAVNGAGVASATGDQVTPSIVRDASGGVLVAWEDFRSGNGDVYVQDMSSTGFGRW
ncbi:MAG TPA: hypothetical protein VJS69_01140, partial [Candidatus Krumholzibacteria bacterium]|nr:hypothetical protein [Candidatus Krumholzibacteria bacterium]